MRLERLLLICCERVRRLRSREAERLERREWVYWGEAEMRFLEREHAEAFYIERPSLSLLQSSYLISASAFSCWVFLRDAVCIVIYIYYILPFKKYMFSILFTELDILIYMIYFLFVYRIYILHMFLYLHRAFSMLIYIIICLLCWYFLYIVSLILPPYFSQLLFSAVDRSFLYIVVRISSPFQSYASWAAPDRCFIVLLIFGYLLSSYIISASAVIMLLLTIFMLLHISYTALPSHYLFLRDIYIRVSDASLLYLYENTATGDRERDCRLRDHLSTHTMTSHCI